MVDPRLLAQAKQLDATDRIELIGELWQTLDHDDLPVTQAEKAMLDERIVELEAKPESGHTWGDVEARLRSRAS